MAEDASHFLSVHHISFLDHLVCSQVIIQMSVVCAAQKIACFQKNICWIRTSINFTIRRRKWMVRSLLFLKVRFSQVEKFEKLTKITNWVWCLHNTLQYPKSAFYRTSSILQKSCVRRQKWDIEPKGWWSYLKQMIN